MRYIRLLSIVFLFGVLFFPASAQAITGPCPTGLNCSTDFDISAFIITVVNWLLAVTLVVDVLFLIIGGFMYMTSAGNEERHHKANTAIVNAIVGLAIIILSYVIATMVANFFITTL